MWSFTLSKKRKNGRRTPAATAAAVLTAGSLLASAAAHADTTGGYPVPGYTIVQELGGIFGGNIFNFPDSNGVSTSVDLSGAIYAFVANDYLGVAQGTSGSYTVNYQDTFLGSVSYTVPGRIAFHTREGSLITGADDFAPLNGGNFGRQLPAYPVSPLAGSAVVPARFYWDYPSYATVSVDGASRNLGFADSDYISTRYADNKVIIDYLVLAGTGGGGGGTGGGGGIGGGGGGGGTSPGNVTIRQTIELVRSKARIQWEIVNSDTIVHTVGLRFSSQLMNLNDLSAQGQPTNEGFFVDPTVGHTNRRQFYTAANMPTHIDVVRRRAPILSPPVNYPNLHVRQILRSPDTNTSTGRPALDVTPPDRVLVVDAGYFIPERNVGFVAGPLLNPADPADIPNFDDGIATGLYWDPQPIQPGGRRVIVTYYGVGTPTENLLNSFGNLSYATGTEAVESLSLNTAAVTDPVVQANKSAADIGNNPNIPQQNIATRFYAPNRIQVFGTLYNRTLTDPQFQVPITNVNMTLNLPTGLRFAVPDPNSPNTRDVPLKPLGDVAADKDARASWFIEPTGEVYGAVNYTLSIQTGNAGSTALSRTINIPATPLKRVTASNFQMISFPFEFDPNLSNNGDPNTVINGITRPVDPNIHFIRWIPNPQSLFGEGGYRRVDRLAAGESYFYRASFDRVIFANGVFPIPNQAPADVAGQTKVIQIQRGWNMIGNPYVFEIPLNFLQLIRPDNLLQVYSFTEAVNAGMVRGGVFTFNPARGDYDFFERFDAPIRPWEGYWVFADSDLLLKFLAPPQVNAAVIGPTPVPGNETGGVTRKPKEARGAIASRAALVAQPTVNEWKLQLVARRKDGFEDAAALVGVSRSAKDGDDMRDLPKPPMPYENFVYVGLVRDGAGSRYAQDLRAPGGTKKWDVEVSTDQDGPVTLSWPNAQTLPRRLRLSVKDLTTGRVTNVRGASSLTVNMTKGTARRFEVTAQPAASQPLAITNTRVTSTKGGAGYTFAFNVNQDATVSGRVLTLSGKVAAPIATGRSVTVGENRLHWNGRAADGAALPAGAYLVEIKATTDEGEPVIVKRPVQLIR